MSADSADKYKDAGVDIAAGEALVQNIAPLVKSTRRTGADGSVGGFGGIFDLKAAGYSDPLLVSGTDGVGTKLALAMDCNDHSTIGIDLVAMCANDLIVQGAEPLFFLDYMATGALDVTQMTNVVKGIAEGCKQSGCALIGGETAEMPGLYNGTEYDLAGFCVGAVERDLLITGADIQAGDVILGLASSGPHSNGYSLIRKIIADTNADLYAPAPFDDTTTLGKALLTPTELYIKPLLAALHAGNIKGLAHITGGGLLENIPRILPARLAAKISADTWHLPPVFGWLMQAGKLSPRDMARTFNAGIGMAVICEPDAIPAIADSLKAFGLNPIRIGKVMSATDGSAGCIVSGNSGTWAQQNAWSCESDARV